MCLNQKQTRLRHILNVKQNQSRTFRAAHTTSSTVALLKHFYGKLLLCIWMLCKWIFRRKIHWNRAVKQIARDWKGCCAIQRLKWWQNCYNLRIKGKRHKILRQQVHSRLMFTFISMSESKGQVQRRRWIWRGSRWRWGYVYSVPLLIHIQITLSDLRNDSLHSIMFFEAFKQNTFFLQTHSKEWRSNLFTAC